MLLLLFGGFDFGLAPAWPTAVVGATIPAEAGNDSAIVVVLTLLGYIHIGPRGRHCSALQTISRILSSATVSDFLRLGSPLARDLRSEGSPR